jgi:hypothetical protein
VLPFLSAQQYYLHIGTGEVFNPLVIHKENEYSPEKSTKTNPSEEVIILIELIRDLTPPQNIYSRPDTNLN